MDADEVDEPLRDEAHPFMPAVKEFAHRDRRGGEFAEVLEVADVFGTEGVFDEEGAILLQVFDELHGEDRRNALVHVVKQFDFVAQFFAEMLEQFGQEAAVRLGIPRADAVVVAFAGIGCRSSFRAGARAVCGLARNTDLNADMAIAFGLITLDAFFDGFER